jgi:diaminohydroxyphosphoribosylaminopyrimidine deaminase / 5-amino-6-(5-phosphoribosylamino)uracil reductase
MARDDGGGQWITGEVARTHGNQLRGGYDCLLTGIGTVLADNPQMNVRAPNPPHPSMVRAVADRQLRLPLASHLVKATNQQPTWVVTSAEAVERNASHASELREAGVTFLVMEDPTVPPFAILKALAAEGITRLLIEAGPGLSHAFLAQNQVETLHWYRAPVLLGNAGKSPIDALHSTLAGVARAHTRTLGDDIYERYELNACLRD